MERNESSSSSLDSDNHRSPRQSQWLQSTLSDMNNRMSAMMTLLEENRNSSGTTENSDKRRLELFQMLEEFNSSYCSLAQKYDQLMSKLCNESDSGYIPSSSTTNNKRRFAGSTDDPKQELSGSSLDSILRDSDGDCDNNNIDLEYLKKLQNELMINDYNLAQYQTIAGDLSEGISEDGNVWSDLNFQVTKLMEENLRQQAELARRNIEKKLIIKKLQLQLQNLKHENRDLQSCISCLKGGDKDKQFQMSKLKRMFSRRLFD